MALPAIADLRRALPDASLTIAARPAIAPLFTMVPGIDDVVVLEKRGRESFSRERHENDSRPRFDVAVLFPNSFYTALTAWRAGIPDRWGYRTDWRRPLLTRAIEPPSGVHQIEYYQHLVNALGFPSGSECPGRPHVAVSDELREMGVRELKGAGWDGVRPLI